jgi:branched-chain amino acid transport system ATP-binding protein
LRDGHVELGTNTLEFLSAAIGGPSSAGIGVSNDAPGIGVSNNLPLFAMTTLLALDGLQVSYGGIRAVKGIDLTVGEGELVCLIGANGAGKTTTLKAITGLVHPAGGRVVYAGEDIGGRKSFEIARRGLALVPEGRGVFPQLSIEENLRMGAYARDDKPGVAADMERMFTLFPRLKERRAQTAGTLSGGEQQMLAIGRALMSRPRLLLLDEPSMGLAPLMVQKIFEVIRAVAAEGVTMLLVEQNARLALEASHRGYVLEGGVVTLSGEARSLLGNPQVRQAYLGE